MSTVCHNCNSSSIEIDPQQGNSFCTKCGTVLEENTIVAEITFGEASTGAAVVQGSYVGVDQARARTAGPYRKHATSESREQTMYNGRRNLQALGTALRLPDRLTEAAQRYFNLAISHNFIQGRRNQHVVAACLYIVCRLEKTSHMLIDFSDVLQISVFSLGSTFVRLVKELNIPSLPLIDPSIYITRFAAMLEFGAETHKIASDAMRLVSRMNRDWMQTGRRPAGICGACILLAARMNNFQRSVQEIIQVVKIADTTLRKRLEEFKETPSGALTVQDFRNMWLEDEFDPPSFIRSGKRNKVKNINVNDDKGKEKEDMRAETANSSENDEGSEPQEQSDGIPIESNGIPIELNGVPRELDDISGQPSDNLPSRPSDDVSDSAVDNALAGAVTEWMENSELAQISADMQAATLEKERSAIERYEAQPDTLSDLDDEELDQFILTEDEVTMKTRVWMEFNRDYLEQQREKKLRESQNQTNGIQQPRKRKRHRPRDSTAADLSATPEESTRKMLSERKFSKKINYDAVKTLFDNQGYVSAAASPAVPGSPNGMGSMPSSPRDKLDLHAVLEEDNDEGQVNDHDWKRGLNQVLGQDEVDFDAYQDYEDNYNDDD